MFSRHRLGIIIGAGVVIAVDTAGVAAMVVVEGGVDMVDGATAITIAAGAAMDTAQAGVMAVGATAE